jgi:hypothetical protein
MVQAARKAGRPLTAAEREHVDDAIRIAQSERDDDDYTARWEAMQYGTRSGAAAGGSTTGFGGKLVQAGFHYKSAPSVELSAFSALGTKAPTLPPTAELNPTGPTLVPLGRDSRFLWPSLPRQDAGTNTAVTDYRQTSRAVTGSVERAIDATTEKAELDLALESVVEPIRQLAVTISDVPNIVLEAAPLFRRFFDAEGRFVIDQNLDSHVMDRIAAAGVPFGNAGTGMVAQIRGAVTAMRAHGAAPSLLVLNPADAAALDLTADAGGSYIFPLNQTGGNRLWGLRVIERAGNAPPYVLDPAMLGTLYLGAMRFDADPFSGFTRNVTTLRVETNALFHVRDSRGARRIAAA